MTDGADRCACWWQWSLKKGRQQGAGVTMHASQKTVPYFPGSTRLVRPSCGEIVFVHCSFAAHLAEVCWNWWPRWNSLPKMFGQGYTRQPGDVNVWAKCGVGYFSQKTVLTTLMRAVCPDWLRSAKCSTNITASALHYTCLHYPARSAGKKNNGPSVVDLRTFFCFYIQFGIWQLCH